MTILQALVAAKREHKLKNLVVNFMTKAENGKTFLIKNITKTSNKAKTIQAYLLNSLQNKPL